MVLYLCVELRTVNVKLLDELNQSFVLHSLGSTAIRSLVLSKTSCCLEEA